MVEVMKKVSEKYEVNAKSVRKIFPKALVLDVTIDGGMNWLDPAFPTGGVRIPGMKRKGLSVMGVWEGLKIFKKKEKIDESWMFDEKKLNKVRGCKVWGRIEGIIIEDELMEIEEAKKIFKEIYKELVREKFSKVLQGIRKEAEKRTVVLLDYKEEKDRPFNHVEVLKEILVE